MARITTISLRADVAEDRISYIRDVLRSEYPKTEINVTSSAEFSMRCNIESDRGDACFNVTAPMLERNLMSRVNRLVNYHNS